MGRGNYLLGIHNEPRELRHDRDRHTAFGQSPDGRIDGNGFAALQPGYSHADR
jgi:hypothetical protein